MLFFFFFQFFWFIFLPGVFKSLCVVSQYLRYLQVNYYEKNSLPIWSFISSFMNCLPWLWVSEATQSCPTLCGPVDCNPPGSSIHVILQARILEWLAISFARGSSQLRDRTQVSHIAGRRFNLWATREAMLSRLVVTFLPRNKRLLLSWLQSPSAMIWSPNK